MRLRDSYNLLTFTNQPKIKLLRSSKSLDLFLRPIQIQNFKNEAIAHLISMLVQVFRLNVTLVGMLLKEEYYLGLNAKWGRMLPG